MKKNTISLPMATLTNTEFVEIRGKNTVGVENHRGILEYSPECISVGVKCGKIAVVGRNLQIIRMDHRRIEIAGQLERVELI